MTNYVYGSLVRDTAGNGYNNWRCMIGYDLATTSTAVTIHMGNHRTRVMTGENLYPGYDSGHTTESGYIKIGGTTVYTATSWFDTGVNDNVSRTYTRTHSAQTVTLELSFTANNAMSTGASSYDYPTGYFSGTSTASTTVTIPARPSYAVTYNANGGTGAPASQVKWHDETLTLQAATPTRTQYKFLYWNTKADGTGTRYYAGASYAANAALTLYAIWQKAWDKPTLSNLSAVRCGQDGTPDECGGYLKVSVDWTIDSIQLITHQSDPQAFSVTASSAAHGQSWTDSGVPSGLSGTRTVVLGDGTARPDAAYALAASVTDANSSASASASLAVSATYAKPSLSVESCAVCDSGGTADPLGGYVAVRLAYSVTETDAQGAPTGLSIAYEDGGSAAFSPSAASGTVDDLDGPWGYAALPPTGGAKVGTATLSDKFNTVTCDVVAGATAYTPPSVSSLRCYRCDDQGAYADEGGFAAVEFDWAVFACGSQSASVSLKLMERDTGRTIATRSYTPSGTSGSAAYVLTPEPGDATSTDWTTGETVLLVADKVYTVTVSLSDPYAVAQGYEAISMAYYTLHARPGGHGIAFGQPSTMEAFEVGMEAYFNDGVHVTKGQTGGTAWDDLSGEKWGQYAQTTWYSLSRITKTVPTTSVDIADGTVSVMDSGDLLALLSQDGLAFYDVNGNETAFYGAAQMARRVTWNNLKGVRSA